MLAVLYVIIINMDYSEVKSKYAQMSPEQVRNDLLKKITQIDSQAANVSINTLIKLLDTYTSNKILLRN